MESTALQIHLHHILLISKIKNTNQKEVIEFNKLILNQTSDSFVQVKY